MYISTVYDITPIMYNIKRLFSIIYTKTKPLQNFEKIQKNITTSILETYNINAKNHKFIEYTNKIILKNRLKQFSECSKEIQDTLKIVYSIELNERFFVHNEWNNLQKCLRKVRLIWAIKSTYYILYSYFTKGKRQRRLINIWENIQYKWNDNDISYLEYAIKNISNPERKSIITYLLSRIKDRKMKKRLKNLGKNPSQLDLLLQQCKKWQIMLTNWLNTDGSSWFFKELTQTVSGSRRCHSLIISGVIKDKKWLVKDLKVIQSTLNGGVHEISFRKYVKENYSESDFLVASFPKNKITPIILNAKNHIWEKYDRLAMILDIVTWWDFNYLRKDITDINKTYCTALVFDAICKSGYDIPKSHLTPSDILLIKDLIPEYACYCDKL